MNPQPKKKRIKLNPRDYEKLREEVWLSQLGKCHVCGLWASLEQSHLHHRKSRGAGGDDSSENCILVHSICHRKIHDGVK